ncbi:MAG TPA: ABC transporter permease subunit [Vicinamibacterales bacterium]
MMPPARLVVWLCARQELQLAVRSRWTQTFTAVFAILALAVAASGYVLSGGSGMQDFARTGASLVQLVLLLVPLTALVFGVLAITPEAGAAELIFSQPVARKTILAGRFLGVFIALVAAQSIGFGAAGLVLFLRTGQDGLAGFAGIVAGAIVLTGVFLGIAAVVAAGDAGPRRARNLAAALVVWFLAVILFDVAALAAASLLPSGPASRVLMTAAIVNPVGAVRTAVLLLVEGPGAFGAASLAFLRFTGGTAGAAVWLAVSIAFWLLSPAIAAIVRLNRADL